jgi:hypothetical protein
MDSSLVSVIVLTFNSAAYVERCLRSLERQTHRALEVLVVDAGSTDGTRAIVERFDERFRWLELPGSDMGAARNHGLRHSHGAYLAFLDSDDFYLPAKVERQVAEMQAAPELDVLYCAAWHFRTGDVGRVGLKKAAAQPARLKDYLEGRNHNLNTMCIRRRVWEAGFAFGEGDRGRYGEEWRLQLSMAQRGLAMAFRPEPLVVVELRPDSHTLWTKQWTMKQQALGEVEQVASRLSADQRATIDLLEITDGFRRKLVVALLLDGQKRKAAAVASSVVDPARARRARSLVALVRWLPERLLSALLRRIWLWRQDRSFEWRAAPPALQADFAAVQPGASR